MRIRESIQAAVDIFDDKKALSHDDKQAGITHVIGQAQSGVLCIDLLSRHVNKDRDSSWLPKLEECLDTQLLLITEITHSTVAASKATGRIVSIDDSAYPELVRLQGSVLLSSVAVCATLGTQILPKLSVCTQLLN